MEVTSCHRKKNPKSSSPNTAATICTWGRFLAIFSNSAHCLECSSPSGRLDRPCKCQASSHHCTNTSFRTVLPAHICTTHYLTSSKHHLNVTFSLVLRSTPGDPELSSLSISVTFITFLQPVWFIYYMYSCVHTDYTLCIENYTIIMAAAYEFLSILFIDIVLTLKTMIISYFKYLPLYRLLLKDHFVSYVTKWH